MEIIDLFDNWNFIKIGGNMDKEYDKYVKVVYQTEPIGEKGIILYLTTFDIEAFEKDQKLKEIPKKESIERIPINPNEPLYIIERRLNSKVEEFYESEILKMANYIEKVDRMKTRQCGNVTNVDNVYCDIIRGNVVNCDNVHCKEIKGNTVNCEIYMK